MRNGEGLWHLRLSLPQPRRSFRAQLLSAQAIRTFLAGPRRACSGRASQVTSPPRSRQRASALACASRRLAGDVGAIAASSHPACCNLYRLTKGQAAIRDLFRARHDRAGNLPLFPSIFPDQMAPIVRTGADGERELVMARWIRALTVVPSTLTMTRPPEINPPTSAINLRRSPVPLIEKRCERPDATDASVKPLSARKEAAF